MGDSIVSKELLRDLQMIMKEEFGVKLDQPQVATLAEFLVQYFSALLSTEMKGFGSGQ